MNKYDEAKTLVYDALFVLCDCDEDIYNEAISLPHMPHSDMERTLLDVAGRLAAMSDLYYRERLAKQEA